jgi:hypothetical protein
VNIFYNEVFWFISEFKEKRQKRRECELDKVSS